MRYANDGCAGGKIGSVGACLGRSFGDLVVSGSHHGRGMSSCASDRAQARFAVLLVAMCKGELSMDADDVNTKCNYRRV